MWPPIEVWVASSSCVKLPNGFQSILIRFRMMSRAKLLLRAIVFCLILGPGVEAMLAATFTNPYRLPTATDPYYTNTGDINGDGVPDFIWATSPYAGSQFNVYLSQPGGGWKPGPSFSFPSQSNIWGCALADVNRDKHLDLVCSGAYLYTSYVHVYLGNGDGTFQAPITTIVQFNIGASYADPLLANEGDLNGDGIPDFFMEDRNYQPGYILLSDGKGSFQPPIHLGLGPINNVIPVAADVNGDGIPDLLYPEGPEVALGKGGGNFGPIVSYRQSPYEVPICIFHDMDGDGHLDAVCEYGETNNGDLTGISDLIVLHGNADGSFNTTPISQTTFGGSNAEYGGIGTLLAPLYVADINGDGILDILGISDDGLAVLYGGPNVTFSRPLHYAVGLMSPFTYGAFTYDQGEILDVNGDGQPDIVANGLDAIYISYGKPDGTFATAFAPEVAHLIGYSTVADFNGDGIPDIAATGDAAIKVSFGKGDGTFSLPVALPNNNGAVDFSTPLSATNAHIVHGDFNGDGKVDLMAIGSPSIYAYRSYILWGNGDGTFQDPVAVPGSTAIYPFFESLVDQAVYDINHDGRSDLIANGSSSIGTVSDRIVAALSNGDGTFSYVTTMVPYDNVTGSKGITTLPALADFNGDGKLDAAYGSLSDVYVVKGHGDGSFDTSGVVLPIPPFDGQTTTGSISIAAADIDGDGNQDIAVLAGYSNAQIVWVYYGNGNGGFSSPVLAATPFGCLFTDIVAADLSRSGRADLIVKTSGTINTKISPYLGPEGVGIINSLPGRAFDPTALYFAGSGLSSIAVADLNRDGWPDLVFGNGDFNFQASSVTILLNEGDVPVVSGVLKAIPEPSEAGQPFQLIAALTPPSPATLGGSVSFTIDGNNVGSAPMANNTATLPVSLALSIGTHSLGAVWPGDSTYDPVTLAGQHTIVAIPTTTVLISSMNPAPVGTTVVFTATTSSSSGTPSGSIAIADGGTTLATAPLVNGVAKYSTSSLSVGTHAITATYAANGNFAASRASLNQVINGLSSTVTLTAAPNPAYVGEKVTLSGAVASAGGTPTGTLTFFDGTTELGIATLTPSGAATLSVAFTTVGIHNLTAAYSGNSTLAAATSAPYPLTVGKAPTQTAIASSLNPAPAGSSIVFTATTSAAITPSGFVQFFDGATPMGSPAPLNAQGVATYTTSSLGVGMHAITAQYSGNPDLLASTSPILNQSIVPFIGDFKITIDPTSASIYTGQSVTVQIAVTSINGFNEPLALACAALPAQTSCSFMPASLTGGQGTAKLVIQTTAPRQNTANGASASPSASAGLPRTRVIASSIVIGSLIFIFLPVRFRRGFLGLGTLVICAVLAGGGCGDPPPLANGTPPGAYDVIVSATYSAATPPLQHAANLHLTVKSLF